LGVSSADLLSADFWGADFLSADFWDADLWDADLYKSRPLAKRNPSRPTIAINSLVFFHVLP
jgi:hypothetical protein